MKTSRTFAAALSGLTLLAVSAFAQSATGNSSATTGGKSGAAGSRTQSTPSSPSTSSSDDRSMNSSTTSSSSGNLSADANTFGPGASQFKTIDTDADGRVSRAEFTAAGSAAAALTGTDTTSTDTSATKEKKHWWNRSSSKANDMDPSETFSKLDTDNDGFLSQSELASANAKLKK